MAEPNEEGDPYTQADAKHDICLQAAGIEQREFDRLAHQLGSIDQWTKSSRPRFGGPIPVALELAQGPIVAV